jgi:hypothetical protein
MGARLALAEIIGIIWSLRLKKMCWEECMGFGRISQVKV